MKVLVVQRAPNRGGSTMSALELAKGFLDQGNNVTVLFAAMGTAVGEFITAGCDIEILQHTTPYGKGVRGYYKVLRAASELPNQVRTIQRLKPDCVYINSSASVFFAVASRIARVPCVLHLRESMESQSEAASSSTLRNLLVTIAKRAPCAVVANSEYTARSFFGTSRPRNLKIIYNGIDESFLDFSPSQESCRDVLGLCRDKAIVGIPGTLRPVKGQAEFLQESVAKGGVCKSAIIAITGDFESAYGQMVRQLRLGESQGRVVFLGALADMRPFYRACDVVCVPSKDESFGRVVVESMAIGTPVVASGVGGIKEIIPSDRFGRVANGQDVERNCKDIMDLLSDKKASQLMAAEAKQRVRAVFSERARSLACAALLAELTNRPNKQT